MKIKFSVPGEPVAQARPRVVRTKSGARGIDPAKSRNYKAFVKLCAIDTLKKHHSGNFKLLDSPLKVKLEIYRSIQKSSSKKEIGRAHV